MGEPPPLKDPANHFLPRNAPGEPRHETSPACRAEAPPQILELLVYFLFRVLRVSLRALRGFRTNNVQ